MVSADFAQKLQDRWDELVINNRDITPEMRTQLSQISNEDLINASNQNHVDYFKKKYPDHIQHPYQVLGSQLLLTISPELSIDSINKHHNDIGITGTADLFNFRSDNESLAIETIIHDILSLYDLTGQVPGILNAVYPYSDIFDANIVTSAFYVPIYALKEGIAEIIDIISTPEMIEISGSALGGQLGGYIADNTFASQLLGRSVGSTVSGVVGSAIGYGVIDNESLEVLAISERFGSNLISSAVSLSAGEVSDYLIDEWKIEDPLAQIGVSTLVNQTASYGVALSADYLFGEEIASKYFGATGDLSIGSFGSQLVNAGASALGSYIGSDLYDRLIDWNVLSERFNAEGVSIGGSLGGIAAGLIGGGTASSIGSLFVAGSIAGPVGSIVLVAAGTLLGSVIGGMFGDDDLPRAGYSVTIEDGKFVYDFGWDNDGGNAEIALTMAENATDFLNYIASAVGGQVYASGNEFDDIFYYGHYSQDYFYKPLSATPDNAPSGPSEWRYPYLFQSLDEAIITGVVEQIGNAIIEGGDRFQKRALLTTDANNFNDLARDIAVAKEYGIALDNWALQQKFIEDLNNNAISEADEEIIDLRNRPWDVFSPPFNPSNVPDKTYQIPEGFTIDDIEIKLENSELIIEYGETEYRDLQWGITQTENRTQYISFSNGDLYAILLTGNQDDESEDESYQSHLVNGERAESIQVINVVESQAPIPADEDISITREGNDLVITITGGEITPDNPDGIVSERVFADAVTNDVAELLRFPDGDILRVIFAENSLELVKENFPFNLQKIKSSNILDFGLDVLPSEVSLSLSGDDLIINGVTYTDWLDEELAEELGRIELFRFANGNTFKIVVNGNNVELQHEFVANWNEILARASELNLDAPQASDYYTRANFTPIFDGTPQGGSNGNSELDVPDSYLFTDFSLAVVDLTADGLDLIPATASNIILDLDDDEYFEQMGWISPTDAFLVWDQDNDGLITNFDEYISLTNYTETTFIGSLDSNNDGILNRNDTHFEDLRL